MAGDWYVVLMEDAERALGGNSGSTGGCIGDMGRRVV